MSKTRSQLRELVRAQVDMDAVELPDTLLDPWLEDAFERTLAVEDRWPFFEHQWLLTTVANQVAYPKAGIAAVDPNVYRIDQITSVLDVSTPWSPMELAGVSHDVAEDMFGIGAGGTGVPAYWSEWGNAIHLWMAPVAGRTIRIRGFRQPLWLDGAAVAPDCDERLHLALFHFVTAQVYLQQEDEILSSQYMQRWQDAVERAHDKIMASPQRRPIVMSGGSL